MERMDEAAGAAADKEGVPPVCAAARAGRHMLVALLDGRVLIYALHWDLFIKEKQAVLDLFLM